MKSRGGPPLWLMNSRDGPLFLGCMLMNSRGGPPILEGGPPLGTISMDQTVDVHIMLYKDSEVLHTGGRSFSGESRDVRSCRK